MTEYDRINEQFDRRFRGIDMVLKGNMHQQRHILDHQAAKPNGRSRTIATSDRLRSVMNKRKQQLSKQRQSMQRLLDATEQHPQEVAGYGAFASRNTIFQSPAQTAETQIKLNQLKEMDEGRHNLQNDDLKKIIQFQPPALAVQQSTSPKSGADPELLSKEHGPGSAALRLSVDSEEENDPRQVQRFQLRDSVRVPPELLQQSTTRGVVEQPTNLEQAAAPTIYRNRSQQVLMQEQDPDLAGSLTQRHNMQPMT